MQSGEERQEKRTATSGAILPEKNQNILHQILVTDDIFHPFLEGVGMCMLKGFLVQLPLSKIWQQVFNYLNLGLG